ncbi:hypothetical protein VTN49DRAFT_1826 [Thermomyces lanuginosus]|uniref:uncharacterized protein n=1 Tax=Thermomyces lanuginosus TaxID=5541 RepID=UPI0037425B44
MPGKPASREVTISKALSTLLRHSAEKENIKISKEGYVNVADVLAWRRLRSLNVSLKEVLDIVANSDKQRYSLLYAPPSDQETARPLEPPGDGTVAAQTAASAEKQKSATAHALSVRDDNPAHFLIRATQGHSIKSIDTTLFLERLTLNDGVSTDPAPAKPDSTGGTNLPNTVVHGTYHGAWPLILESGGLRPMSRTHVHFATGPPLEEVMPRGRGEAPAPVPNNPPVISGMRSDAEILIYIDLRKALRAGCPFYRSENNVILSEGFVPPGKEASDEASKVVPLEFFDIVVERKAGLGVLWENGRVVRELPPHLASKKNPKAFHGRRGKGKGKHTGS